MSRGFPPLTRTLALERSAGRCERCCEWASDVQLHHRRPRGMGSSRRPDTNSLSNCAALCGSCHRWVESYRLAAYDDGWLVKQSQSPREVPVLRRGEWVLLDDEGGFHPVEVAS